MTPNEHLFYVFASCPRTFGCSFFARKRSIRNRKTTTVLQTSLSSLSIIFSGRKLRFLANVDPVAVRRALSGLDPRETLVVVISKTFTTAETMLNAKTVRDWLIQGLGKLSKLQEDLCIALK